MGQFTEGIANKTAASILRCFQLQGLEMDEPTAKDLATRSMAMSAHGMLMDQSFAGNGQIRNEFRRDLGNPTNVLESGEKIFDKRRKLGRDQSCSRSVRNGLYPGIGTSNKFSGQETLVSVDTSVVNKDPSSKSMIDRVTKNLFKRFRNSNETKEKKRIKYALKELKKEKKDSFLYCMFEMSLEDKDKKNSTDIADDVMSFIDDNEI